MANQSLLLGIAGGLAAAIGLAVILSAIFAQSTAQMTNHQGMMGGMMGPGMTTQSTGMHWQWDQRSMFNANGMSTVDNVQISGIAVTGDDEITVNLRYDGSETSPAVTVIALTNSMFMQDSMGMSSGIMQGGQGPMMMSGSWSMAPAWQNNTEWQQWHEQMSQWHSQLDPAQWGQAQAMHNQMMAQGLMGPGMTLNGTTTWPGQFVASQSQAGSSVADAGWTSGSAITIQLEGDGSAYDDNGVHVMVFPLTS